MGLNLCKVLWSLQNFGCSMAQALTYRNKEKILKTFVQGPLGLSKLRSKPHARFARWNLAWGKSHKSKFCGRDKKIPNSFADTAKDTARFNPKRMYVHAGPYMWTLWYFIFVTVHTLCLAQLYTTCFYLHTLVVHALCLDQFYCCTFILKSRFCSLLDCVHNCRVQLYTG